MRLHSIQTDWAERQAALHIRGGSSMANETRITWLGHSTFLVDTPGGKRILIDPFLENNPKCPDDRKTIDRCDLMLITHAHSDHCADAIPVAKATSAQVITMVEHAVSLMKRGM